MERGPQAVIAERDGKRVEGGEIGRERQQHHVAHVARPCRADEDAVHLEGEHAADRGKGGPGQVVGGGNAHALGRGDQRDDGISGHHEQRRQGDR